MSQEGEEQKLSKKELKRLAKKAEKDAKKGNTETGDNQPSSATKGDDKPSGSSTQNKPVAATTVATVATPKESTFFLANASSDDCVSTLKAAIAAKAFGIDLFKAPATLKVPCLVKGPCLFNGNDAKLVTFGGNSIAKAMALLGASKSDASTINYDPRETGIIDEWLELERTCLGQDDKTKKVAALDKIEYALTSGCGSFLVSGRLSVADIAVVVTLSQQQDVATYSPAIQHYLHAHLSSPIFIEGTESVQSLVPSPPFDVENDPSMIGAVNSVFYDAISAFVPDIAHTLGQVIEKSKVLRNGDYQCKEAMPLFAQLKAAGKLPPGIHSPQQVAQEIVKNIPSDNPVVDGFEINGPGFILCRVKASYLEHHLNTLMNSAPEEGGDPKLVLPKDVTSKKKTVVVDFSSPNIAKEMHVGHLRSTIIGETVCRILEFTGADVKRVNHVGDWGTQFGMLITFLKESFPNFGKGDDNVDIGDLTQFYKKAKMRFDEDAVFKKTSQLNVVKLQAGDEECRAIWQVLCDVSRKEFEKVYKRLDITLEECGESFYNNKIPAVIEEFEKSGLIASEDGGAKCVFVPKYKIPLMLQKSDGGYGYDSTDMAALKYRTKDLGASRIVYITDYSQGDHFQMCFSAAEMIGWVDPKKTKLEHIGFGTVMGDDGKRFKTRSGDTVRLVDLLDEAVQRMETSLHERIAEKKAVINEDQVPEIAAAMGYGAVKYFDLRRNPTSNYKFSYDDMLDTKGNTAIYLLYAHARLESIISKGKTDHNIDVDELLKNKNAKIVIGHPSERNLAFHLQMFSDMIVEVLQDLYPYRVCDFLYALSIAVSDFVTKCKVLGSDEMESRLLLCRASAIVMRQCFDLLAIRHVNRI